MKSTGTNVEAILESISEERKEAFHRLHQIILDHLAPGIEPGISYGNLGYVVPHSIYPAGYHCKPSEPLPLAWIASQKNSINFYHMGIYADLKLLDWFLAEYPKHSTQKLDMSKSCMRFKKPEHIPFELLGQLMGKMTAQQWIDMYESLYKK